MVLENREDFPLNFVEFSGSTPNIRKVRGDRKLLLEDSDVELIIGSYRDNVALVHQCQPPWIPGFGKGGGRIHTIPDGSSLRAYLNSWAGDLTEDANRFVVGMNLVGCDMFDTILRRDPTVKAVPPVLSTEAGLNESLFCMDYVLNNMN